MNLSSELQDIEPKVQASPWDDHEHYRGYAVMSLPFSSGNELGLRVFPQNDFAPYTSVWHHASDGNWSIYNDGPSLNTTCPRAWGKVLKDAELTQINVDWIGRNKLRVEMEKPRLVWTMTISAPLFLRFFNGLSAALPRRMWKSAIVRRFGETAARQFLGLGKLRFSFITPSGHDTILIPRKILFIDSAKAELEGRDLGEPIRLKENPTIGGVPLPKRPTFMIGEAQARIRDREEYERTRKEIQEGPVRK